MTQEKNQASLEKIMEIVTIKQRVVESEHKRIQIKSPDDAARVAIPEIGSEDREVFLVMVLNVKNEIVAIHRASIGSVDAAIVQPREVMKAAILNNGSGIIVAHNHPSYNLSPSPQDIEVTERLIRAGELLGIQVLDSLIVSEHAFLSLKEKGYV